MVLAWWSRRERQWREDGKIKARKVKTIAEALKRDSEIYACLVPRMKGKGQ